MMAEQNEQLPLAQASSNVTEPAEQIDVVRIPAPQMETLIQLG